MDKISGAEYTAALAFENAEAIRRMQAAPSRQLERIADLERRVTELESMLNALAEKVLLQ